jgi:DNA-binding CsgD family transcriptional regulator
MLAAGRSASEGKAVRGDFLEIIEAAYAESADPELWLKGALEAIRPHLDRGTGVFAHRFAHGKNEFWRGPVRSAGADAVLAQSVDGLSAYLNRMPKAEAAAYAQRFYPKAPMVVWASELAGGPLRTSFEGYRQTLGIEGNVALDGYGDSLGVLAADPSGHGCIFFTLQCKATRLPTRTTAAWRRVAAHLVTGYRLVRQRSEASDAVLTPSGKVLHLEPDVTPKDAEPLSEAARAIDRARGKLRRTDPDRALALWRGLVDGRWSLVDHFDHDGRRYVVAKRNAPEVLPWHSLTARESQILAFVAQGQTHKIIAYQLGLSPSAVGESLVRARKKVGARSRLDLVSAYLSAQESIEP